MPSMTQGWARRYVERFGWSPVPLWTADECSAGECSQRGSCPPNTHGKHPRVLWQDPYLPDPVALEQVNDWWGRWPHAGVAILTGHRSGIDVIDIDPKNGGSRDLLAARWDDVPTKLTVYTGSGGGHLYVVSPSVPTSHNLAKLIDVPGVDYRGDGGLVVAPPTTHFTGRIYSFVDLPPEPIACPAWLEELATRRHREQEESERRSAALAARLAKQPASAPEDGRATDFGRKMITTAREKIAASHASKGQPGGRHDTVLDQAYMLGGLIPSGHVIESYIYENILDAANAVTRGEHREAEMSSAIQWGIEHGQCRPWEPENTSVDVTRDAEWVSVPTVLAVAHDEQFRRLVDVIAAARRYQHLPDPSHLICALAVAATKHDDDEPVWLLQVAAPSSGKTETIKALHDQTDAHLDDVTAAGLLSYKTGKNAGPIGVLARNPGNALITFGDLSSLLATSDRGNRDVTFALLRRVYDGHVTRNLGSAPGPLSWSGRVTIIAAVTGAIDNYSAHNDALGPRWLYIRLPEATTQARREAAKLSRRGNLAQVRGDLRDAVNRALTAAWGKMPQELPDNIEDAIVNAALVTCWGRAAVPRHGYGRREIDGVPTIEEPPRLIRQLRGLARGMVALGVDAQRTELAVRRVAADSMPLARRKALEVLADGEPVTTSELARRADLHRHVARRQLEELELIGVAKGVRHGLEPADDDVDRRPVHWQLDGADGVLIGHVLRRLSNMRSTLSEIGWHETLSSTPHPPKYRPSQGVIR